jgi:L-amino acid N-acyltransferase YncA
VKLRLATAGDAAAIAAIYAPIVRDTIISFEVEPPTIEEMRGRIERVLEFFPWLVCEREGRIAGYAYAGKHGERFGYRWSVDVSCYVHPDARRLGIGSALYLALLRILRKQGFHGAFAGITLPNEASVRLHESVGFERIATYREVGYKLGAWHDTGWWQCRLGEPAANPQAPRALRDLGLGVLDDL